MNDRPSPMTDVVTGPPSIELSDTWFRVEGHLVDLVALNHWRQQADSCEHAGHGPDAVYALAREWLEKAHAASDPLEDGMLMINLFSLLKDLRMSAGSRYAAPRHVGYHCFLWGRYQKGLTDEWPPSKLLQAKYLRKKKSADPSQKEPDHA